MANRKTINHILAMAEEATARLRGTAEARAAKAAIADQAMRDVGLLGNSAFVDEHRDLFEGPVYDEDGFSMARKLLPAPSVGSSVGINHDGGILQYAPNIDVEALQKAAKRDRDEAAHPNGHIPAPHERDVWVNNKSKGQY